MSIEPSQTWWEWLNYWMSQSASDWHPIAWAMDNNPILIAIHVIAGVILALGIAYQSYIGGYLSKEHRSVTLFFAAFLVMCGVSFITREVVIFIPVFWIYGAIKSITAILAFLTMVAYAKLLPTLKNYPTPKEFLELKEQKLELERRELELNKHLQVWNDDVGHHINLLKGQQQILAEDLAKKGLPVTSIDDSLHKSTEPISKEEALTSLNKIKTDLNTLMGNLNNTESE